MNWERYNKLTSQKKEEFNFKFNYKEDIPRPNILALVCLYQSLLIILFVFYLINAKLVNVSIDINTFNQTLKEMLSLTGWVVFLYIFIYFIEVIRYIFKQYKKFKFLKQNGA